MTIQIRSLVIVFSGVLNVVFVTAYVIQRLSAQPKFACEEVELPAEQRARIETGRDRFLASINEIGDKIIASYLDLVDLTAADAPDRRAMETTLQEMNAGQQLLQRVMTDHLLELKQILTSEQRTRFFAVLRSRIRAQTTAGPAWFPLTGRPSQPSLMPSAPKKEEYCVDR